jgi:hypothetical protein
MRHDVNPVVVGEEVSISGYGAGHASAEQGVDWPDLEI